MTRTIGRQLAAIALLATMTVQISPATAFTLSSSVGGEKIFRRRSRKYGAAGGAEAAGAGAAGVGASGVPALSSADWPRALLSARRSLALAQAHVGAVWSDPMAVSIGEIFADQFSV